MYLGALAGGLGCFPLVSGPYRPETHSRAEFPGIRSLVGFGRLVGPLAHSVLYPQGLYTRLTLKLFRGEPAISQFD